MNELADDCKNNVVNATDKLELIKRELKSIPQLSLASASTVRVINENTIKELKEDIIKVKKYYSEMYDKAVKNKDEWMAKFQQTEAGKAEYQALLTAHQNKKLEDLVKNITTDLDPVVEDDGKLVASTDPIFRDGTNDHFIRSHFFAPTKNVFGKSYSTYSINIFVLWMMSLVLLITLYFDVLRKLLKNISAISNKVKSLLRKGKPVN